MNIEINKDWRLRTDVTNIILERFAPGGEIIKGGKRKGELSEDHWEPFSFHPSFESALNRLMLEKVKGMADLEELVKRVQSLRVLIVNTCERIAEQGK